MVEQRYTPTLKRLKWKPTALFDTSAERRRSVAKLLGIRPLEAERPSEALDSFDAAIVAAPHAMHEPLCVELLRAGKHVLVEKPMALNAASCAAMNRAASQGNGRIAVALQRRQALGTRWLKEAIAAAAFGRLCRFTIREGFEYSWPLTTDTMWRKKLAGGGVLVDTGAHTMDQIICWFGVPSTVEYFDDVDAEDGVEVNCLVRMRWLSGLEGEVELTRGRLLSNQLKLYTEKGELSLSMSGNFLQGSPGMLVYRSTHIGAPPFKVISWADLMLVQLVQFRAYASGESANVVTGDAAAQSVELIERCYAKRQRLEKPWIHYTCRQHA